MFGTKVQPTGNKHYPRGVPAAAIAVALTVAACEPGSERPILNSEGSAKQKVASNVGRSGAGNYLAGRQAQKKQDFGSASRYLQRALGDNPENGLLLRRTFLAKLADGRVADAVPLARKVVHKDTASPIARLVLVVEAIGRDEFAAADKVLTKFPNRGFNRFMKPLLSAWILTGQGKGDLAVAALDPLKKQEGLRVLYELHSALLSDVSGNAGAAADHYKLARDNAELPTLRVVQGYGRHLERAGKTEKAKNLYDVYLNANPDSVVLKPAVSRVEKGDERPGLLASNAREGVAEALFNIASTMTQQNLAQLALIYGRLSTYLRPDLDLAHMLVAGVLQSMGRHDDAIAVYDQIDPKSPLYWSARLRIAENLEAAEKDDDAIRLLQRLSDQEPSRPDPLISLGDLLRANKRFNEAVSAYDKAVSLLGDLEKRHWTILYSRGIALERSRQWARAEKDLQQALELSPNQPYVLNYLGYSWVDQGVNLLRAEEMIKRAVKLRPNDGYIVDSLGWALYRLMDFEGAVGHLERAVELRPEDPTINDHLGDAYWQVGRHAEARFQWQRALSLQPEPDQVSAIEKKILRGLVSSSREKDS